MSTGVTWPKHYRLGPEDEGFDSGTAISLADEFTTDPEQFARAAQLIEATFAAETQAEVASLEQRAFACVGRSALCLAWIALDQEIAPDVRGVAARMFVERLRPGLPTGREDEALAALVKAPEALVRLGVVLGHEDRTDLTALEELAEDHHPRVKEEAERILSRRASPYA